MRSFVTTLLVVAALGAASCGFSQPAPQSVIVIAIDTLRADHLGVYGYPRPTSPNIDAFAAEAVVFDRFYSASTWTLPSFGTLFTGRLPARHAAGVVVRAQDIQEGNEDVLVEHADKQFTRLDENLPTMAGTLRRAGYRTIGVINNVFLRPEFGLDRGFEVYDYDPERPGRSAERAVEIALAWLDDSEELPVFLFVHFMDVHMPYDPDGLVAGRFTEPYGGVLSTDYDQVAAARRRIARGDELMRARYTATYDEEIAYVDYSIGLLFDALKERGLWDDSLIIVTSDHGEAFFEHSLWEHGSSMFDEVVRVPLLVRGPGVRPGRSEAPAAFADILPTVIEALGIESDASFFGASLWPNLTRGTPLDDRSLILEGTLYQAGPTAIIDWPYKAIYQPSGARRLLYNLEADANERVELSGLEPERLDDMIEALRDRLYVALEERGAASGAELDPATLKNLRALGYIR